MGDASCECYNGYHRESCDCEPGVNPAFCADCDEGLYGEHCTEVCVASTTCNGNGRCTGEGTCVCYEGFTGERCNECAEGLYGEGCETECSWDETCSEGGRCPKDGEGCECFAERAGGACDLCSPGRYGGCDAAEDKCFWNETCSGRGRCLGDASCECYDGAVGPHCDSCSVHGYGPDCGADCDWQVDCLGRGRCTGDGACECYEGFSGESCESCGSGGYGPGCEAECTDAGTCNGQGRCAGDGSCECYEGFTGILCDLCTDGGFGNACGATCRANTTCSGNGRCLASGDCACFEGFAGEGCSTCEDGFYASASGECEVRCDANATCSAHGRCLSSGGCECYDEFSGEACDLCSPGTYGEGCDAACFANTTCHAHGRCRPDGGCECEGGYTGEFCEVCPKGAYGPDCQAECFWKTTCSEHGRCTAEGTCECHSGYSGESCEACLSGSFGDDCATFCDDELTCSGQGRCRGDGICECDEGFTGASCLECTSGEYGPGCLADNKSCSFDGTCDAAGRCLADGSCDCFPFWNCSAYTHLLAPSFFAGNSSVYAEVSARACPAGPTTNECLRGCSGEAMDECQLQFDQCVFARGGAQNGTCECIGRLRACTVDAGCIELNNDAFAALCEPMNCTEAQCQYEYPAPTMCNWDAHTACEDSIATCQAQAPFSTNDTFDEQYAKHAAHCACFHAFNETYSDPDVPYECGNVTVRRITPRGEWIEEVANEWVRSYERPVCTSECMNATERELRWRRVAYDCAVCGDGDIMPGRETCDDTNRVDGDGCSYECQIEVPEPVEVAIWQSGLLEVSVQWNHTNLTVLAASQGALHRVLRYEMALNVTQCPHGVCSTRVEHYSFDFEAFCGNSSCVFTRPAVSAGDFITATVWAVNVAGRAENRSDGLRFAVVPTPDVGIVYSEVTNRSGLPQALLTWVPPTETGYGDNYTVPIDAYRLEIARCASFAAECIILDIFRVPEQFAPNSSAPLARRLQYPMRQPITVDQQEGYPYWYRVTSTNFWGDSAPHVFQRDFVQIISNNGIVDLPDATVPIPVAIVDANTVHIWIDGKISSSVDMHISGFPQIRYAFNLLAGFEIPSAAWTAVPSFTLRSSNVPLGTSLDLAPPVPPQDVLDRCSQPCFGRGTWQVLPMPSRTAQYQVYYFTYPDAVLEGMAPSQGPIGGGNTVKVRLTDFSGPETREVAGLANLPSAASGAMKIEVWFSLAGLRFNSTMVTITDTTTTAGSTTRTFEADVTIPESPARVQGVAGIEFFVGGQLLKLATTQTQALFEYVGTQLTDLKPQNAQLNPGSGGAELTVQLANMPPTSPVVITVGGRDCPEIPGTRSSIEITIGVQINIKCQAPELPVSMAPNVNVTVFVVEIGRTFSDTWQYRLPPPPVIQSDTLSVGGVEVGAANFKALSSVNKFTLTVTVDNALPKNGINVDRVYAVFHGSAIGMGEVTSPASFFPPVVNLKASFQTPGVPAVGVVPISLFVCANNNGTESCVLVNQTSDGSGLSIEFWDNNVPDIYRIAPASHPASGRSVVVLCVSKLPETLTAPFNVYVGAETSDNLATVYGKVTLSDWKDKGPGYQAMESDPLVSRFLSGVSEETAAEIAAAVSETEELALQTLSPANAGLQTVIVLIKAPAYAGPFAGGVSPSQDVTLSLWNAGINTKITSTVTFVEEPAGAASAVAATAEGSARTGLDGDVGLTITLSGFAVVFDPADVYVNFGFAAGDQRVTVTRLRYSTRAETRLEVVVPVPAAAEVVNVTVYPTFLPANQAFFSFEYYDDRIPVVLASAPYKHYQQQASPPGSTITATVTRVVGQPNVQVEFTGAQAAKAYVTPTSMVPAPLQGEGAAVITFAVPAMSSLFLGVVKMRVFAGGKASDPPTDVEFVAVPSTPPVVRNVAPSSGVNNGGESGVPPVVVSIKLQNMYTVASPGTVSFVVTLPGSQEGSVTVGADTSFSTIAQTDLTFTLPQFSDGGTANVMFFVAGREHLNQTFPFTVLDNRRSELSYAFPQTGKAGGVTTTVEVEVSRFGTQADGVTPTALSDVVVTTDVGVSAATASLQGFRILSDGSTAVLDIAVSRSQASALAMTVTVKLCAINQLCAKRTATFPFTFRDPAATFVLYYNPLQTFVDGQIPMVVQVENLPTACNASDLVVSVGPNNASSVTLIRGAATLGGIDATLELVIPGVSTPVTVSPRLLIPKLGLSVSMGADLTYIQAPNPIINQLTGVFPKSASLLTETFVQLEVQSFAGVTATSDIVVEFRWPCPAATCSTPTVIKPTVQSFTRKDPTAYPTAIQDITITIRTPVLSLSLESSAVRIITYHAQKNQRQATYNNFNMKDPTSPVVSGMTTDESFVGTDEIKVRASASTEVSALVTNAKSAIVGIVVADVSYDIATSIYDAAARQAYAVWSQPSDTGSLLSVNPQGAYVYGQTRYEANCGSGCTTSCCGDGACPLCTCSHSCFTLQYYDDLQPFVTFNTALEGPEIGGTQILVTVARLPSVASVSELSVIFDGAYYAETFLQSSSDEETRLQIYTPAVEMDNLPTRLVSVEIVVTARPDRSVSLDPGFLYRAVDPVVSNVAPTTGKSTGGVPVTVTILYFPVGAIGFDFDSTRLLDDSVTVSENTVQRTIVTFSTPESLPGIKTVRVFPKSNPFSDKAKTFDFVVEDASQIALRAPIPVESMHQPLPGSTGRLFVSNYPAYETTATIRWVGTGAAGVDVSVSPAIAVSGGIATMEYQRPTASALGTAIATLTVRPTDPAIAAIVADKMVQWAYKFYDGGAVRFTSAIPTQLPTTASIYGRAVNLNPLVRVRIQNFPQDVALTEVTAYLGGSVVARVVEIDHTQKCPTPTLSCSVNRSVVVFESPNIASPIEWQVQISARGVAQVSFPVQYFVPCSFDTFCAASSLTADPQWLSDNPPPSEACFAGGVCIDHNTLPTTQLRSVTPVVGPADGGTVVTVRYEGIPAFKPSDVPVTVGSGSTSVQVAVMRLEPEPGSTLVSNRGTLVFAMPKVPGGDTTQLTTVPVRIAVNFGNIQSEGTTSFQYTPVLKGAAVLESVWPAELPAAAAAQVVTVRLSNFPRLSSLADRQLVVATFAGGAAFAATSVIASDYTATSATFTLDTPAVTSDAVLPLTIYHASSGPTRAAAANLTVLPPPEPTVNSFFPTKGTMGSPVSLSTTVSHLDPALTEAQLSVRLFVSDTLGNPFPGAGGTAHYRTLAITEFLVLHGTGCLKTRCARVTVKFSIAVDELPSSLVEDGALCRVEISASTGDVVSFSLPMEGNRVPSLLSVDPVNLDVDQVQSTPYTIIVRNVADDFCAVGGVVGAGCTVTFGGKAVASVLEARTNGKQRTIVVQPAAEATSGPQAGVIGSGTQQFTFNVFYTLPLAAASPIDGVCAGGGVVSVSAVGWGTVPTAAHLSEGLVTATMGGSAATVQGIDEAQSLDTSTYSRTVLTVRVPQLGAAGSYTGVVRFEHPDGSTFVSSFNFDCYDAVSLSLAPSRATLEGKTELVVAQRSVTEAVLANFPPVATASDLSVAFGTEQCDGTTCGVNQVSSFLGGVRVQILVPPASSAQTVKLDIRFQGSEAAPSWGTPGVAYPRTTKSAQADFTFYVPSPEVLWTLFCLDCASDTSCLDSSLLCLDGASPAASRMAVNGLGRITVVIDNVPPVSFDNQAADGRTSAILPQSNVAVEFSQTGGQTYYGTVVRVLYSEATQSKFEVSMGGQAIVPGTYQTLITIQPDTQSSQVYQPSVFPTKFVDTDIALTCVDQSSSGCRGPDTGAPAFDVTVTNTPLTAESAAELLKWEFGGIPASAAFVSMGTGTTEQTATLTVSPPNCDTCSFTEGKASVALTVSYLADGSEIASTDFTFHRAPAVVQARFDSSGSRIEILFDQDTNRAQDGATGACAVLFGASAVGAGTLLGEGPLCSWDSARLLFVNPENAPSIVPGDTLTVLASAGLRDSAGVSPAAVASFTVQEPAAPVKPQVLLDAPPSFDLCSSFEAKASLVIPSPRPVTWSWRALNDATLNAPLVALGGATFFSASGTQEFTTLDKEYLIGVTATDFMGTRSQETLLNTVKRGRPSPALQFVPTAPFATYRNQDIEITGAAVFSSCPVDTSDLVFSWTMASSSPAQVPSQYLNTIFPKLLIPAGALEAGKTFLLTLTIRMGTDDSMTTSSNYALQTLFRPLTALINGGASAVLGSSQSALVLSGAASRDPDSDPPPSPQGLSYQWVCTFLQAGQSVPCRTPSNQPITWPATEELTVAAGTLAASAIPYTFTLIVSKGARAPASFSVPVTIVNQKIPSVGLAVSAITGGFQMEDGSLYLNQDAKATFAGFSDTANTLLSWSVDGGVDATLPAVAPLGYTAPTFVLQLSPAHFQRGARYTVQLTGSLSEANSGQGFTTGGILINSPPSGGVFRSCVLDLQSAGSACQSEGLPISDTFRMEAVDWSDVDVPITFQFGYLLEGEGAAAAAIAAGANGAAAGAGAAGANGTNGTNASAANAAANVSEATWFAPSTANFLDMEFPSGRVTCYAVVSDSMGASTARLEAVITVGDVTSTGRRLLQSANANFAKARNKMKDSLKAFRANKVNQAAGSIALEGRKKLSPAEAMSLRAELMGQIATGTQRTAGTASYACETFGAGSLVTAAAADMGASEVVGAGDVMGKLLTAKKSFMSETCTNQAAKMMSNALLAQMYGSALAQQDGETFLNNMIAGMNNVMYQAAFGKVAGESAVRVVAPASDLSVTRMTMATLLGQLLYQNSPTETGLSAQASFTVPANLTSVFGTSAADINVHTHSYGVAPAAFGANIVSPLYGLTLSYADTGTAAKVANLTEPFIIRIPVDLSGLTATGKLLFTQQVKCVYWGGSSYVSDGCNVTSATNTLVTCACDHLTTFAINQDPNVEACGDSRKQSGRGEACDDRNLVNGDGCSSECTVEANWECYGREGSSSTCVNAISGSNPRTGEDGARATFRMTGFASETEVLENLGSFGQAVADQLTAQVGVKVDAEENVFVLTVCYGSQACTVINGDAFATRRLLPPPAPAPGALGTGADGGGRAGARALLQSAVEVSTHIVPPSGLTPASVAESMAAESFLTGMAAKLETSTGKTLGVTYSVVPELKVTAPERPDVMLGAVSTAVQPLPDQPADEALPFVPAEDTTVPGLSVDIIVLIAVGIAVVCMGGAAVLYMFPLWLRIRAERAHVKVLPNDLTLTFDEGSRTPVDAMADSGPPSARERRFEKAARTPSVVMFRTRLGPKEDGSAGGGTPRVGDISDDSEREEDDAPTPGRGAGESAAPVPSPTKAPAATADGAEASEEEEEAVLPHRSTGETVAPTPPEEPPAPVPRPAGRKYLGHVRTQLRDLQGQLASLIQDHGLDATAQGEAGAALAAAASARPRPQRPRPHWERPGVEGAGARQRLLQTAGGDPGRAYNAGLAILSPVVPVVGDAWQGNGSLRAPASRMAVTVPAALVGPPSSNGPGAFEGTGGIRAPARRSAGGDRSHQLPQHWERSRPNAPSTAAPASSEPQPPGGGAAGQSPTARQILIQQRRSLQSREEEREAAAAKGLGDLEMSDF